MENNKQNVTKNKKVASVPLFGYEAALNVANAQNRRLFILCILLIIGLVGSNIGWLLYESQYEDMIITQEAYTDGDGNATISDTKVGNTYYGNTGPANH